MIPPASGKYGAEDIRLWRGGAFRPTIDAMASTDAARWGAWLLVAQALVAAAMTGVIWQVQLVTYPQFLNVGAAEFPAYHAAHTRSIGLVVAPLMLAELALALAALWWCRTGPLRSSMRFGAGLVLALWATTWLWQVPLHARLESEGRLEPVIRELIAGNWLRTLLWSARAALLGTLVGRLIPRDCGSRRP